MLARNAVVAALGLAGLSAGGCISIEGGTGAHFPVSGAPTRVASGTFAFGGTYARRDRFVVDVNMGYVLGPLGEKSNALFMFGGRFSTASHGWHPGYYGGVSGGFAFPNDLHNWDAGPTGGAVHAGGGVAWTWFRREENEFGALGYASMLLGLAFHHQEQSNIGPGDFLGVELTLVVGGNLFEAFINEAEH